ncbi:MAG: methylated-DNA-protein-cysteine methyltransferase-like protein [Candidatus Paceibacteria bacterium]|jgi:methylated-DNA-protein-cysteine methyltransferase-like protein
MDINDRNIRLYSVIQGIPAGKVATYGQIASLAGLPGAARLVGKILSGLPADTKLPWHRVINAAGKISLPQDSDSFNEQKKRLVAENIALTGARISLKKYQWRP